LSKISTYDRDIAEKGISSFSYLEKLLKISYYSSNSAGGGMELP
jgi:hypothetical protein